MSHFWRSVLLFNKLVLYLCLILEFSARNVNGSYQAEVSSHVTTTMISVSRLTADTRHYEKKLEELDYELTFNVAYIILPEIEQQLHTMKIAKAHLNDLHYIINSNITKMLAHTNVIRIGLINYQNLIKSINYHLHYDSNSLKQDLAVMRAYIGDMERYYVSALQGCAQAWRDIRKVIIKVLVDEHGSKVNQIMSLLDDATITLAKGKDGMAAAKSVFDSGVSVTLYDLDLMMNYQHHIGDSGSSMHADGAIHKIFITLGFIILITPFFT